MIKQYRVYNVDTNKTIATLNSYELAKKVMENHFELNENVDIETLTKELDKDEENA